MEANEVIQFNQKKVKELNREFINSKEIELPQIVFFTIVQTKGAKVTKQEAFGTKEGVLERIEAYKANGWESSTVFYLSGAIHVKLKGKSYGVKTTIEAIVTPNGVKEPQLKDELFRLQNLKSK
jgi:hypothetical protein